MASAHSDESSGYVHKLRLQAQDGAFLNIDPESTASPRSRGMRLAAKFVGVLVLVSSVLALAAHQLVQ